MQRAIELARRGWYTTRPNPRVGCVIVRGETVIGEGWHERAGEDHAEKAALADVARRGASARGATAYVTLEPCSHTGRTAPCVDALIEAGVERVVVGATDPNPQVNGQGIGRLREAGIEVITDVVADRCRALNPGFEKRMRESRPRVRVKLAMSLDGRTAAADGTSQWITGDVAREDVHRLRAESGVVMVGRGTLVADDPGLNVRLKGQWPQPLPAVLDTRLQITPSARLFETASKVLVYTACTDRERIDLLEQAGAEIVTLGSDKDGLDLPAVLADLGEREINDVLVESGPQLAGALADAGLVDEYVIYMAPKLLGDGGRGLLHMPGIATLADAPNLVIDSVEPLGRDWRITARPSTATKD
ncbi:bifunctional diaminohydroxyphosphoribosylaminopyrimidine deaminase/5-amino-6-(5-phosphoribosylamino)uracil reductase RibD [uncultured Salinisphaera sp.]|uniref:bifunctional diaminohydroxyphosphoribosylaminopyrimidine deaminase/5-amino-6-(5-phosphoribosylamino)uracil reductase RibD n=1 Tax=uncultured Salinisphaera sp. TaxID=359372 RepID=UPI0032B13BAB